MFGLLLTKPFTTLVLFSFSTLVASRSCTFEGQTGKCMDINAQNCDDKGNCTPACSTYFVGQSVGCSGASVNFVSCILEANLKAIVLCSGVPLRF